MIAWLIGVLRTLFFRCFECGVRVKFGKSITDSRGRHWCTECYFEVGPGSFRP